MQDRGLTACVVHSLGINIKLATGCHLKKKFTFTCAGNDGSLRIWNAAKGVCTLVVKQHSAEVTAAVWLPDGERIITGSHDKNMVPPAAALLLDTQKIQAAVLRSFLHCSMQSAGQLAASCCSRCLQLAASVVGV